ncbi:MAG: nucleoside-diphosphate sugar epimerase/dehydratase [Syntrophomonadaceae bacterium]|nr:nucleoside-diphosphate sugar epimerase/dehydratase [Syntrophomonadaceae bacterium]
MRSFSQRIFVMLTVDALLINTALYFALMLRFDGEIPAQHLYTMLKLIPIMTIVNLGFLLAFKLYGRVWEYASWGELLSIIKASTCSMLIVIAMIEVFHLADLPRSVYIISWGLIILNIGISRLWWRGIRDFISKPNNYGTKVLIVGAGAAGAALVREIQTNTRLGLDAIAFVDDDPQKIGKMMLGLPIKGNRHDIPKLVAALEVQEIIIAMPSVKGPGIRDIIKICEETSVNLRILPSLYKSNRRSLMSQVRRVKMEDLLGRKPVNIDMAQVCGYIQDKTVLVTGGGGSIGSELCRQIAALRPKLLIILDNCENNLFDIENELIDSGYGNILAVILYDVKHSYNVEDVFQKYHPQVVFHAAAYKHVPMMKRNPEEALWNNVVGSLNTAEMAAKYESEAFILISTDKAVNPTSIMGATKRLAELIIKDFNRSSETRFAAVRFGNVLGSRGSVIPTFEKQIERGGPVTVTHPDMKRYFMTIPEAVGLVIQAGSMADGGEIFVLDMGEPIRIVDLAYDLIRLYGYQPGRDIEVVFMGVRPGEKLSEELFYKKEEITSTSHERIFISNKEVNDHYIGIHKKLTEMIKNAGSEKNAIIDLISNKVPEFQNPNYTFFESKTEKENLIYLKDKLQKKSG